MASKQVKRQRYYGNCSLQVIQIYALYLHFKTMIVHLNKIQFVACIEKYTQQFFHVCIKQKIFQKLHHMKNLSSLLPSIFAVLSVLITYRTVTSYILMKY